MLSVAQSTNEPLYMSIDDTVTPKKKPSSRAVHPMEGAGWHDSHLEGKQVYGYQIFAAIISSGNHKLCYRLRRCCPEHGTKVDSVSCTSSDFSRQEKLLPRIQNTEKGYKKEA